MPEFFHGWKRKLGCVTLAMACLFATFWLISLARMHVVMIRNVCVLTSSNGQFTISQMVTTVHKTNTGSILKNRFSPTAPSQFIKAYDFLPHSALIEEAELVMISYWSIVLPLTAISAWLLLSKPRRKIEAPIAEDEKP